LAHWMCLVLSWGAVLKNYLSKIFFTSDYKFSYKSYSYIHHRLKIYPVFTLSLLHSISLHNALTFTHTVKNENFDIRYVLPQRMMSCLVTIDVFLQQQYPVLSSTVIVEKHKSTNNDNKIDHVAQIVGKILTIR